MVTSAARRPRKEEGPTSEVDPDARFGADNERHRFTFGYKIHAAVDQGTGLVRNGLLTSANIQDVGVETDQSRARPERSMPIAAYHSRALRDHLQAHGFGDGVMRRGQRAKPLTVEEVERNRRRIPLRRRSRRCLGPSGEPMASRGCATTAPPATSLPSCSPASLTTSNAAWCAVRHESCLRPDQSQANTPFRTKASLRSPEHVQILIP